MLRSDSAPIWATLYCVKQWFLRLCLAMRDPILQVSPGSIWKRKADAAPGWSCERHRLSIAIHAKETDEWLFLNWGRVPPYDSAVVTQTTGHEHIKSISGETGQALIRCTKLKKGWTPLLYKENDTDHCGRGDSADLSSDPRTQEELLAVPGPSALLSPCCWHMLLQFLSPHILFICLNMLLSISLFGRVDSLLPFAHLTLPAQSWPRSLTLKPAASNQQLLLLLWS